MREIAHRTVAALETGGERQLIAVETSGERVEPVSGAGQTWGEVVEHVERELEWEPDHVLVLGETYLDIQLRDVAKLVALECRERRDARGSVVSEGPLYAVLEYERAVINPEAWVGKRKRRVSVSTLMDEIALRTDAIIRAVNTEDRSLSDVRLLLQQGRRSPARRARGP